MSHKLRKGLLDKGLARLIHELAPTCVDGQDPFAKVYLPGGCSFCGHNPCVKASGMCGPCTFDEIDTANGNW